MTKPKAKRTKAGTAKRSAEDKKRLFVEAYLSNNGNLTQSALAAGYSKGGAAKQGYRKSKDPQIMSMIGQAQKEVLQKYRLTAEDVFRSIAQELHFHPARLYNEDGSLKKITELDDDTAMALSGIEVQESAGGDEMPVITRKVKWSTKSQAREQLIKILGMYKEKEPEAPDVGSVTHDIIEGARAIAFVLASAGKMMEGKK